MDRRNLGYIGTISLHNFSTCKETYFLLVIGGNSPPVTIVSNWRITSVAASLIVRCFWCWTISATKQPPTCLLTHTMALYPPINSKHFNRTSPVRNMSAIYWGICKIDYKRSLPQPNSPLSSMIDTNRPFSTREIAYGNDFSDLVFFPMYSTIANACSTQ